MLWAGTSSPVLGFGTKEQGPREGSIVISGKREQGAWQKGSGLEFLRYF